MQKKKNRIFVLKQVQQKMLIKFLAILNNFGVYIFLKYSIHSLREYLLKFVVITFKKLKVYNTFLKLYKNVNLTNFLNISKYNLHNYINFYHNNSL